MHHIRQALVRMRLGDPDRAIARAGLIGRKKLAALRRLAEEAGWLDPAAALPEDDLLQTRLDAATPAKRATSTVSTLEAHRERIAAWLAQGVDGTVIHATLTRDHGYTGSYSSVRRMLARLRGEVPVDTTVRLDYAPGEAAQVDFGAGPNLVDRITGEVARTWVFVMTLCFSRHQYIEFVFDQTVLTWLGCHRRAFTWFNGIPERVIVDNAKCAITRACVHDPAVQRAYADCAEGYGFRIEACPPHDPQKKGIVEAGVKYVKRNFMALRAFRDLADLNAQGKTWVMETAGRRRHGTTGIPPLERFELERGQLRPLPDRHPDLGSWHRVKAHRDCHVQFDRSWYSVPFALAGQTLWLKASPGLVTVQDGQYRQVAAHVRAERPGTRRTVADHLPPDAARFFAHDRAWCLAEASVTGPACQELIEALLGDRIAERLRAAQGVIRLREKYGADRLDSACRRALDHGSPHYRTVKTILAGGHDQVPTPAALETTAKPHGGRFARDAASLFQLPPSQTVH